MGSTPAFTGRLGLHDRVYVLRVGFNEAGAIDTVELDLEEGAKPGQRGVAQFIGRNITEALHSLPFETVVRSYTEDRLYAVRGFAGVSVASNPADMVMKVLDKMRREARPAEDGGRRYGHLRVV